MSSTLPFIRPNLAKRAKLTSMLLLIDNNYCVAETLQIKLMFQNVVPHIYINSLNKETTQIVGVTGCNLMYATYKLNVQYQTLTDCYGK